ncbi:MAG: CinA family protein [Rhodospirillales bacterium]|nr:CinA family protein [Rhodospirillales bacterium]
MSEEAKMEQTSYLLPPAVIALSKQMLKRALETKTTIATAESCTGGLIAAALTEIPGGSSMFERGFVTYSNEAKTGMLGVPAHLIDDHGAVSEQVAWAMAEGALENSKASVAVSTTGVAGPDGGTPKKPVGMVCFAIATRSHPCRAETMHFPGDRAQVRLASVEHALRLLLEAVSLSA